MHQCLPTFFKKKKLARSVESDHMETNLNDIGMLANKGSRAYYIPTPTSP